jgi:isopenicillin-N epimerase
MTRYASGLAEAKRALAGFVNAGPQGLILTPGTTLGLNIVAHSQRFCPGDELLTTNHAYSSVGMILRHLAARDAATVVVAQVPFPVSSADEILQSILACVTPRTRFAIIDHIASRSGLIFPIKRIVAALAAHGVDTLVDGAHGPGHVPVDLTDIGAAYYTASCHKWMCAPRGVGFLHVRQDRINSLKPLVLARSCYFRDTADDEHSWLEHTFDWMGTSDPTAVHSLPRLVDFLQTCVPGGGGHGAMVRRNHQLAVEARRQVLRILGLPAPCPDSLMGNMVSIPLPDSILPDARGTLPLQAWLWHRHHVEIQVYSWPAYPKRVLRFTIQLYNSIDQCLWLAERVKEGLEAETLQLMSIGIAPAAQGSPETRV